MPTYAIKPDVENLSAFAECCPGLVRSEGAASGVTGFAIEAASFRVQAD